LTLQECSDIRGKKILDVGCGSGRYCIELAKCNPDKVVGIDFAQEALNIAGKLAETAGSADRCSFLCADFVDYDFDDQFHICVSMGLFDYIADPVPVILKMKDITSEKIIMSFPSKSTYRMAIRKFRYWIKRCPLFFYDSEKIQNILAESGISNYEIQKLSGMDNCGDYFVVARLED